MANDTRKILTALYCVTAVMLGAMALLGYSVVTQLSAHDEHVAAVVGR